MRELLLPYQKAWNIKIKQENGFNDHVKKEKEGLSEAGTPEILDPKDAGNVLISPDPPLDAFNIFDFTDMSSASDPSPPVDLWDQVICIIFDMFLC